MLPPEEPDRIHVTFDDHRLVANAGFLLPVSLAGRLGLGELVDNHVDLNQSQGGMCICRGLGKGLDVSPESFGS